MEDRPNECCCLLFIFYIPVFSRRKNTRIRQRLRNTRKKYKTNTHTHTHMDTVYLKKKEKSKDVQTSDLILING